MEEELNHYEGQVKDGKLHGKGKLTYSKYCIEGTFKDGALDGLAIVSTPKGSRYEALFKEGKLIEEKLMEGSEKNKLKKKRKNLYLPGPGPNPRPSGSFLAGVDI